MADDRKSGPVKPPTIELAAKPAGSGSGDTSGRSKTVAGARRKAAQRKRAAAEGTSRGSAQSKAQSATEPKAKAETPASQAPTRAAMPVAAIGAAAALGALVALAIAYLLAFAGWWPAPRSAETPPALVALEDRVSTFESAAPDPAAFARAADLAAVQSRIDALEAAPDIDTAQLATAEDLSRLQTVVDTLAETDAATAGRLTGIETAAAADADRYATAADVDALRAALETQTAVPGADAVARSRIDALQSRLAELEAAPAAASTPDPATGERLAALEEAAAAASGLAMRIDAVEAAIADLRANLSELRTSAQAAAPEEMAAVRRVSLLPLAISELERLVAAGEPFVDPLASVTAALSELSIPDSVTAAAETGVRPAALLREDLADAAPAMLQAHADTHADADLGTRIMDQIAAAIALRPEGIPEGDDALSVLARLEGALDRADADAARVEFASLPAQMRAASPGIGEAIAALADTTAFVETARAAALDALATAETTE